MGRQLRGLLVSPFVRRRLKLLASKERAADYERLTALIEAGQVTPTLDRTYPLENAREAMQRLRALPGTGARASIPCGSVHVQVTAPLGDLGRGHA